MPLTAGMRLGAYIIEAPIGAGGMGEVYRARDTRLQRTVAIKVLPDNLADPESIRRLEHEALSASGLNHPNILTVYEFSVHDGVQYLATEFVQGETLRDTMRAGRLPVRRALDIAIQIATALDAAHLAGLVHRDIKPENVMVRPDGYVKVLDFGLVTGARGRDQLNATVSRLTMPGTILGTVGYMSPEQIRGQTVDARADIWSLGVVLHEMVSGQLPFARPTTSDVIAAVLEREPASLSSCGVDAPALERVIDKALAKAPEDRYQTMGEVLTGLRELKQASDFETALSQSKPAPAVPSSEAGVAPERRRVSPMLAVFICVVLAASLAGVWGIWSARPPTTGSRPAVGAAMRRIDYWLTVQRMRDGKPYLEPFESSGQEIFESGWKFRFNFRSPNPGFLYLINQGPAPKGGATLRLLFPTPSSRNGSAEVAAGEELQTGSYVFDPTQGVEQFWIVWSAAQVVELERAKRWVNPEDQGLVKDPVEAGAIQRLLAAHSSQEVTAVKDRATRRTVVEGRGELLVRLAELEHIK